jgi:hypothetical protein
VADRRPWRSAGDPNQDWPTLLNAQVCVRDGSRTTGWISFNPTGPYRSVDTVLKATYKGDGRDRSVEALIAVLEQLITQLKRQESLRVDLNL